MFSLFLFVNKVMKDVACLNLRALNRKRELVVTSFQTARSVNGLQKRCILVYTYIVIETVLKVKNDHRSKFFKLGNWKKEVLQMKSRIQTDSNP